MGLSRRWTVVDPYAIGERPSCGQGNSTVGCLENGVLSDRMGGFVGGLRKERFRLGTQGERESGLGLNTQETGSGERYLSPHANARGLIERESVEVHEVLRSKAIRWHPRHRRKERLYTRSTK